jgi:hypothetical protein
LSHVSKDSSSSELSLDTPVGGSRLPHVFAVYVDNPDGDTVNVQVGADIAGPFYTVGSPGAPGGFVKVDVPVIALNVELAAGVGTNVKLHLVSKLD